MENASRALIMAAGILMGLMIISVGVLLFDIFSKYSEDTQLQIEENQIGEFNNKFLKHVTYINTNMKPAEIAEKQVILTAHDVVSIANLAKENNEKHGFYDGTTALNSSQIQSSTTRYIQIEVIDKKRKYSNFESESMDTYIDFMNNNSIISSGETVTSKRYICYIQDVTISPETKIVKKMTIRTID